MAAATQFVDCVVQMREKILLDKLGDESASTEYSMSSLINVLAKDDLVDMVERLFDQQQVFK